MAFLDVAGDMFTANSALAKYCLELIFCALIILGVNFCAKSKCSHWCLLKPQGYSCHCPMGFQLMDDNITCQGKKPTKCLVNSFKRNCGDPSMRKSNTELWYKTG